MKELPVACTLDNTSLQARQDMLLEHLVEKAEEIKMLDQGIALRFAASDTNLDTLLGVIKLERSCCRFLQFKLTVSPNEGPMWLEATGPEGTAEFFKQMLVAN